LQANLNIPGQRLALTHLETRANGETLRLLSPAAVDFRQGLAVDRLKLGLGTGTLDLAGRLLPELDLQASLDKLPLERVAALAGRPLAAGLLAAQIKLKGPVEAPAGSLSLKGSSLRLTGDNGFGLPAAGLEANLTLKPGANSLDASAQMGPKGNLRLRGQVGGSLPLAPGTLALALGRRAASTSASWTPCSPPMAVRPPVRPTSTPASPAPWPRPSSMAGCASPGSPIATGIRGSTSPTSPAISTWMAIGCVWRACPARPVAAP
jgi:hypothetical protein